jgi:hypothetical protein
MIEGENTFLSLYIFRLNSLEAGNSKPRSLFLTFNHSSSDKIALTTSYNSVFVFRNPSEEIAFTICAEPGPLRSPIPGRFVGRALSLSLTRQGRGKCCYRRIHGERQGMTGIPHHRGGEIVFAGKGEEICLRKLEKLRYF